MDSRDRDAAAAACKPDDPCCWTEVTLTLQIALKASSATSRSIFLLKVRLCFFIRTYTHRRDWAHIYNASWCRYFISLPLEMKRNRTLSESETKYLHSSSQLQIPLTADCRSQCGRRRPAVCSQGRLGTSHSDQDMCSAAFILANEGNGMGKYVL